MPEIQIISHRGHTAAIVAGDSAIVAQHVPDDLLAHVQAKALYAMQIQAGELPGPYTDADAERYAHTAASTAARPGTPTTNLRDPTLSASRRPARLTDTDSGRRRGRS